LEKIADRRIAFVTPVPSTVDGRWCPLSGSPAGAMVGRRSMRLRCVTALLTPLGRDYPHRTGMDARSTTGVVFAAA
jgi:hypothetical protein